MTTQNTERCGERKIMLDLMQKDQLKSYCIGYLRATLAGSNRRKIDLHQVICIFFADILYGNSDEVFQKRMDFFEKFRDEACVMTDNLDECFGTNFDFENPSNKKIDVASSIMAKRFIKYATEAYKLCIISEK